MLNEPLEKPPRSPASARQRLFFLIGNTPPPTAKYPSCYKSTTSADNTTCRHCNTATLRRCEVVSVRRLASYFWTITVVKYRAVGQRTSPLCAVEPARKGYTSAGRQAPPSISPKQSPLHPRTVRPSSLKDRRRFESFRIVRGYRQAQSHWVWAIQLFRIASRLSHPVSCEANQRSTLQPLPCSKNSNTHAGMDQQRGRSPSVGHQRSHINPSHSPSPHPFADNANPVGLGLDIETGNAGSNNQQFVNDLPSYDTNEFTQEFSQQFKQEEQQQTSFTQELLGANISPNFSDGDFSLFSTASGPADQFDSKFFMNEISSRPGNPSVNPTDLNMSSPPHHTPTPPNLLQPDARSPPSAHQSPAFNQGQFQGSPGHSRNASLGPESAAFPQGSHIDWAMMPPQFQNHRRTPSEYSDVSASSAAPSPNLGHQDTFESIDHHHSPMQHPQDAMYQEVLGIGSFSLSDVHGASPRAGLSPAHSPAISPRLGPQQLPTLNQPSFMLGMNSDFGQQNIYGGQMQDIPHIRHNGGSIDMGDGQQMVPPQINVEFAPTSRMSTFDPPKPSAFDQDALTPPDRGM